MKRKIIQIANMPETSHSRATMHALCNDGTIWETVCIAGKGWSQWQPLDPVPQPKGEK